MCKWSNTIPKVGALIISILLFGCKPEDDPAAATAYPLLSLFEATKSLDGREVEVVGYFGLWDNDIPVLYASQDAFKVKDGLNKSHIIFKFDMEEPNPMPIGKLCFLKASIWYRGAIPTLDQAEIIKCKN